MAVNETNFFVRPEDVEAFGFDWGQLAVTVGPAVNGASAFSGGVVTLQPGQGHARHNHPEAEVMQLFVVYSPAGPEQALRQAPDFRLLPAGGRQAS